MTFTQMRLWQFYYAFIKPAPETVREVGIGLLTECILRAAGCKKLKPGAMIIDWQKKGLEIYNGDHGAPKRMTKKRQMAFINSIRAMNRIANKKTANAR